jgi:hypothetical protein
VQELPVQGLAIGTYVLVTDKGETLKLEVQ